MLHRGLCADFSKTYFLNVTQNLAFKGKVFEFQIIIATTYNEFLQHFCCLLIKIKANNYKTSAFLILFHLGETCQGRFQDSIMKKIRASSLDLVSTQNFYILTYNTMHYNAIQYNTIQYNTISFNVHTRDEVSLNVRARGSCIKRRT